MSRSPFSSAILPRRWVAVLMLTLFALCAWPGLSRPHIVVFLADDHGYGDSQVYGSREVSTPNMLRLAQDGVTFTHAFVASPSCAPSRAALLTGLMPARNGAQANHAKPRAVIKKWPAYFHDLGYTVAAFGKVSHYKHTVDYEFDHFAHDTFHDHAAIPAALKWLRAYDSERPLCLLVGSNWPHVPWPEKGVTNALTLPSTYVATPDTLQARRYYLAAVQHMDEELGQIYDAVWERLGTNVLFLHSSDHGAQFPFGKWNCYDAGIRTSLLITWPGQIKPRTRAEAMVSWVDILPTLIEAAGGVVPTNLDGRSFLSVLRGGSRDHRDEIFATHSGDGAMNIYPMRSLRTRDWKYILNVHPEFEYTTHIDLAPRDTKPGYWGGYWASWKGAAGTNDQARRIVRRYHERPQDELYDLRNDPGEEHNLAREPAHAVRLAAMRGRVAEWMTEQNDGGVVFGQPRLLPRRQESAGQDLLNFHR